MVREEKPKAKMEPEEPGEPKGEQGGREDGDDIQILFFHVNMFFIPFVLGGFTGKQ